jgi:hypothetical protein
MADVAVISASPPRPIVVASVPDVTTTAVPVVDGGDSSSNESNEETRALAQGLDRAPLPFSFHMYIDLNALRL